MSTGKIIRDLKRGPEYKCNITGEYFTRDLLDMDRNGHGFVYKKIGSWVPIDQRCPIKKTRLGYYAR
jgi:hypothetical protein